MSVYTWAIRPALFALDPEHAHDLTMAAMRRPITARAARLVLRIPTHDSLRQQVLGATFPHPIGLAAGLDKQGTATAAWAALGFSFAEVGTVTPQPQPGNPRPRLFRVPKDRAIINRFGFNSAGATAVARNLAAGNPGSLRLGVNIGRNRDTPNERAAEDYERAVEALHPFADYFVVNVSSPNTSGLRDLQEGRALRALLERVTARVRAAAVTRVIPVLVKVSPDMPPDALLASVDAALEGGAAGVVATNTTTSRAGVSGAHAGEAGGLSGMPLRDRATEACRTLFRHLRHDAPVVGVGGVFTADDAYARIRAGAALVQLYTGLIYEGPGVVGRIVDGVAARLARDGYATIQEAIGADVR